MAMSAFGDSTRFVDDFVKMLTRDIYLASFKPPTQPAGPYIPGQDPIHPYLQKWSEIADENEQNRFDLAAGLQAATEIVLKDLLSNIFKQVPGSNICLAGGVTLNSVMVGKIHKWFPHIKGMYATPTPHDGGLAIGAAQYVWHQVLNNPRVPWSDNFTPYLGKTYTRNEIIPELDSRNDDLKYKSVNDDDVIRLLADQKIVSDFWGWFRIWS